VTACVAGRGAMGRLRQTIIRIQLPREFGLKGNSKRSRLEAGCSPHLPWTLDTVRSTDAKVSLALCAMLDA